MTHLKKMAALLLCAGMIMGLTLPTQAKTSLQGGHLKTQFTSWLDPWRNTQTFLPKQSNNTALTNATIEWSYDPYQTWYHHLYYRIYVNGILRVNVQQLTPPGEVGVLSVVPGATVFWEMEADARENGGVFAYVYDYGGGGEFVNIANTEIDYISATFTAQDDHLYEIRGR